MRILITGGSGFLGTSLARELLQQPAIHLEGKGAAAITEVVMTDLVAPPADLQQDSRVRAVVGDLSHLLHSQALQLKGIDAVVHLAAAVSGDCEANLDLGLQSNLQTSLNLLQAARHQAQQPVFVFASSVAVFGAPAGQSLPDSISDTHQPTPQSSYGIQKFMVEQLVADFTRKGLIHGRNVRLMTVSVRPGKPNGAASSFLSGMFREPLAGQACTVPVPADTRVALASTDKTMQGLMCALTTPASQWGAPTAVNLPALTTTVGEMAHALKEVAGSDVAALLDWQVDAKVQAIVSCWPSQFDNDRAKSLGLVADTSVKSLIQSYASRHPHAITCALTF
ncbi:D-erythronate dehydrogenase [Limnohabitans sp.]|uniref:D-erythronate dehydrogenase n=1 Tax=Limnohabitans sp. TaxID=1907725 RepID=UPI00286F0CC7|nr:D-erythronate dehydrogenase [Limnohabitans sp.]